MRGFDSSIPRFLISVRGMCTVFTLELISDVLHIPRVSHPNYPGRPHLRTVSKDKLSCLSFVRHLHLGMNVKTSLARVLQKVRGS